jgi:hypothetical protein
MVSKKQQREAEFKRERRRQEQIALEQLAAYQWDFHPTKQYVRREGWLRWIQDYVRRREAEGMDEPWTFFTLPGRNALDVGLLYQEGLLPRDDRGFPTVAICDRESATDVVANLGQLLAWAQDHLQKVIRVPDHEIVQKFPYDVINLDFCGPLLQGKGPRKRIIGTVDSLDRIFELQRGCGFLLLLTTRDGANQFGQKAEQMMRNLLLYNIEEEEDFRTAYEARYGSTSLGPCLERFTVFAQLIIPKVIAYYAREHGYRVVEHFAAEYDRPTPNGKRYEMISHTFELEPIGRRGVNKFKPRLGHIRRRDALGNHLSSRVLETAAAEYRSFITSIVQREAVDVDQYLAENPGLAKDLEAEANELANWWEKF